MNDELRQLYNLANAQCEGEVTAEQGAQLEELVAGSADLRRRYIVYMQLNAVIEMNARGQKDVQPSSTLQVARPSPPIFSFGFLGGAWQGTMAFADNHPWKFSYLVASVFFAIAAILGTHIYVTYQSEQRFARDHQKQTPTNFDEQLAGNVEKQAAPKPVFVGKITGRDACQWQNEKLAPVTDQIAKGDGFALKSGLLEIVYATGARVVLQGPCSYTVDSAAGGFLACGKLTAKLEKKGSEVGGQGSGKSTASNPQIPKSPNPEIPKSPAPLFAIRTPTALVTDLGTEFGVEVDEAGVTQSHVYQGTIQIAMYNGAGFEQPRMMHVGESAKIDGRKPVVVVKGESSIRFVREMPAVASSHKIRVLAHFRLGEDDTNAIAGEVASPISRSRSGYYKLERHGAPRYTSDTAAMGSRLAVEFNGRDDWYTLPQVVTDAAFNFGIEAWVKPRNDNTVAAMVSNGVVGCYGLSQINNLFVGSFAGVGYVGNFKFTLGQWYHLAIIREQDQTTFYVNGRFVGNAFSSRGRPVEGKNPMPLYSPQGSFWVGSSMDPRRHYYPFAGMIDEVRVFEFKTGDFSVDQLLWNKNPETKEDRTTKTID